MTSEKRLVRPFDLHGAVDNCREEILDVSELLGLAPSFVVQKAIEEFVQRHEAAVMDTVFSFPNPSQCRRA